MPLKLGLLYSESKAAVGEALREPGTSPHPENPVGGPSSCPTCFPTTPELHSLEDDSVPRCYLTSDPVICSHPAIEMGRQEQLVCQPVSSHLATSQCVTGTSNTFQNPRCVSYCLVTLKPTVPTSHVIICEVGDPARCFQLNVRIKRNHQ